MLNLKLVVFVFLMSVSSYGRSFNGLYALGNFDCNWTQDDLAPLIKIVGDSHYVGLGESVHATEGFSQAKFRIIRFLIENLGFRVLAMETPWFNARVTADYIETCKGSPKDALNGIFSVWKSKSVEDLFQWLCTFNQKHSGDPVHFYGFDTQNSFPSIFADLKIRLEHLAPSRSFQLLNNLNECLGFGLTTAQFGSEVAQVLKGTAAIDDVDQNSCLNGINKISKAIAYTVNNNNDLSWAKIDLVGIKSFQSQLYYNAKNYGSSFVARDQGMALVFDHLHSHLSSNPKTIIWAHNVHLALDHSAIKVPLNDAMNTFGYFLSLVHGSDYAPIALTGYDVSYHWPGQNITKVSPPNGNSVEAKIHRAVRQNAILDLSSSFLAYDKNYYLSLLKPSSWCQRNSTGA